MRPVRPAMHRKARRWLGVATVIALFLSMSRAAIAAPFDEQADALYIQFQPSKRTAKTVKLREGVLVDLDRSGKIFGIEILDVSHRMPIGQLGHVKIHRPVHA